MRSPLHPALFLCGSGNQGPERLRDVPQITQEAQEEEIEPGARCLISSSPPFQPLISGEAQFRLCSSHQKCLSFPRVAGEVGHHHLQAPFSQVCCEC